MPQRLTRGKPTKSVWQRFAPAFIAAGATILVAVIGFVSTNIGHFLKSDPRPTPSPRFTPVTTPGQPPIPGRLVGFLKDRAGNPIPEINVGILNGPHLDTDKDGKFVLKDAPSGDQLIEVQAKAGGKVTQDVAVEPGQTTSVSIVYDAEAGRLGLLSIVAPVNDSLVELKSDAGKYSSVVYGRCFGLTQILGSYDIWLLVHSEHDARFWVQQPAAIVDLGKNSWIARPQFGDTKTPPRDGEDWDLVAVAGSKDSGIGQIVNTSKLTELPDHIRSNVVTIQTKVTLVKLSQKK